MSITLVKTTCNLASLLDMRELVFSNGNNIALAEQNVTCLMNRIR